MLDQAATGTKSHSGALARIDQICWGTRTASGTEPGGSAAIAAPDVGTVLGALATAAEYLAYRASLTCGDFADSPAELCETHAGDLDAAARYRSLSRALGEDR